MFVPRRWHRPRRARAWAALMAALLLAGCLPAPDDDPGMPAAPGGSGVAAHRPLPGAGGRPLIVEVYYYSAHPDQADEYMRLHNAGGIEVDLGGWRLEAADWAAVFPDGTRLPPAGSLYLARSAAAFARLMGRLPDLEYGGDTHPAVPEMALAPAGPAAAGPAAGPAELPNGGGVVALRDPAGEIADLVRYGESDYQGPGWRGWSAWGIWKGEVLDRARDEATIGPTGGGRYMPDTDRAEDWKTGSEWIDLRALRPGQSFLPYATFDATGPLIAYASPDNAFAVVDGLLARAGRSIDINMYDLHHPLLVQRLVAAARRGVRVRALLEGSWEDGIRDDQKWAAQVLHDAGAEVRWLIKDEAAGIRGRYWLNHAKYGIIDGERVFVQSENFARHGMPADPGVGNRGWGSAVLDRRLAAYMTSAFAHDWNPAVAESRAFSPGDPAYGGPPPGYVPPEPVVPPEGYPAPFPAITVQGARVTPVLGPDHTLLQTRGVIGLIRRARHTLLVEQQYIHLHWGNRASGSVERTPNLYLREIIAAARRGVRVRVLVGDHFLDPANPVDSSHTVEYLNQLAELEGLDLEARIIRSPVARLSRLHNKGVIVDGEAALVSSINWSGTSPRFNREVGLIVEHPAVAQYFTDIFYYDWYDGSAPDYPVITQVVPGEFVQVYNPTGRSVDLTGWRLRSEAKGWPFPAGLILAPKQALVLAGDPRAFELRFGRRAGAAGLDLGLQARRDLLRLEDPAGALMDAVAWGGGHPGWDVDLSEGLGLCRPDPNRDTNTRLDWRAGRLLPAAPGCGGPVER